MKIAKFLRTKKRYYSYRIIFIPETIGAIAFIKKRFLHLKNNLIAGFVLSCVGDDKQYSKISSRSGNTFADRVLEHTFQVNKIKFKNYSFLARGSDERQFCSPRVDLPVCTFLRTKFGNYKEYHTSNDNLNFISARGLENSFKFIKSLIINIEKSDFYLALNPCEPFLSKYNLKKNLSGEKNLDKQTKEIIDVIAYCDGKNSLDDISNIINIKIYKIKKIIKKLLKFKIVKKI